MHGPTICSASTARFRIYTEIAKDSITLPDYFEHRFGDTTRSLRLISALVIVVFFTLYTASGVVAGGKLFETVFQLDYFYGLALTVSVVILYTLLGGFLAVSMTDFVQGIIMFLALVIVPVVTIDIVGGITPMLNVVEALNPNASRFIYRHQCAWHYFIDGMGPWLFWTAAHYCPFYGNPLC